MCDWGEALHHYRLLQSAFLTEEQRSLTFKAQFWSQGANEARSPGTSRWLKPWGRSLLSSVELPLGGTGCAFKAGIMGDSHPHRNCYNIMLPGSAGASRFPEPSPGFEPDWRNVCKTRKSLLYSDYILSAKIWSRIQMTKVRHVLPAPFVLCYYFTVSTTASSKKFSWSLYC